MKDMHSNNHSANLILFCGLPGTLKTFLSSRVSGRIGYGYLPTRAVGDITQNSSAEKLRQRRQTRYEMIGHAAVAALKLGANVIVDGGFMSRQSRAHILDHVAPEQSIVVNCRCDDQEARMNRLAVRAIDPDDYENRSAREILRADSNGLNVDPENDLEKELAEGRVRAVLDVDTVSNITTWRGKPPSELRERLPDAIIEVLEEYLSSRESHSQELTIRSHFDDLAEQYDDSTQWRRDTELLGSLRIELPRPHSRVLDIGAGTGLAGEWYAKQGHYVTGIDISPMMLRKAAERLTLTVLADATNLPFLDDYFDLILVRQCLHYVDPHRLLSSARRTLRHSGRMAVSGAVTPSSTKTLWQEFKGATQPLRLRVFTECEIQELLNDHGLVVKRRIANTISRSDRVESLEMRAPAPHGGWSSFLQNFQKIASNVAPELHFSFDGETIEYQQHWVTMWATPKPK